MYNIIPLILILISLSVIIAIAVKKFSVLANLDTENIQAEKEAKFKERIISSRLKRNFFKWSAKLMKTIRPVGDAAGKFFKWIYKKLHELKEDYQSEETVLSEDGIKQKIKALFDEAEAFKKQDNLIEAEKKHIEIIGLDGRNIKAFDALARLYFERKEYKEAKQTFEHVLKLKEDGEETDQLPQTYFDLALVCEATGNLDEAMGNLGKALKLEPNNPRYLDIMLKISIINKDKVSALEAYNKLAEVNPDNQKLVEFKAQIDEL